jgi:ATP-dependent Clp protease protease subunit
MDVLIDGEIVLHGTVGDDLWGEGFTSTDVLMALAKVGRDTDVTVRLNSGGGYVDDGIGIYNAIAAHKGVVTMYVDGVAASSASLIAMSGDEIIMRKGSVMMIHDPAQITVGTADDHVRTIGELNALGDSFAGIYAEQTGETADAMRAVMKEEVWLTAEQAVERGFADRMDDVEAEGPTAFAYQIYKNAPQPVMAAANVTGPTKVARRKAAKAAIPSQQEKPMAKTEGDGGAAAAPAKDDPATNVVNIDAARTQGRNEALAYMREINEICALAGLPEKAQAFIEKDAKPVDVRKELLEARASADAARTISNGSPANQSQKPIAKVDLVADMKRRHGITA